MHHDTDEQMVAGVAGLARRALTVAGEADGVGVVAARALIEGDFRFRVSDFGFGAGRPAYAWLERSLVLACGGEVEIDLPARGLSAELWAALLRLRQGEAGPAAGGVVGEVDEVLARYASTDEPALHAQDVNETLESWTYTELTALHALHNLALDARRAAWHERVAEAAAWHQEVTQPDYTTHEPWALAAFLARPATRPLAEQQLHDTATFLGRAQPEAAAVIAMLLADALHAMKMGRA